MKIFRLTKTVTQLSEQCERLENSVAELSKEVRELKRRVDGGARDGAAVWISTTEAMRRVGYAEKSRDKFLAAAKAARVTKRRVGRKFLWLVSAVDAWIESRTFSRRGALA